MGYEKERTEKEVEIGRSTKEKHNDIINSANTR